MGALCVLLACALMVGIGCKQDDGDRWVSTMGAPGIGGIKSLTFEGVSPVVSTYTEAKYLVQDFFNSNVNSMINSATSEAFSKAFLAEEGTPYYNWKNNQGTSWSYSVKVDDAVTLPTYLAGTGKAGTIKGSVKESWSHNRLTYPQYNPYSRLDGDEKTSSSSTNYTISITSGYLPVSGGYKVAGIVKIEGSSKSKETIQEKAKDKYTESYSQKSKYAGALLIDNGISAAKIRFSTASDGVEKVRSASDVSSSNISDVIVYNLAGTEEIFRIPADVIF